jgi:hypothetical protein
MEAVVAVTASGAGSGSDGAGLADASKRVDKAALAAPGAAFAVVLRRLARVAGFGVSGAGSRSAPG